MAEHPQAEACATKALALRCDEMREPGSIRAHWRELEEGAELADLKVIVHGENAGD